MLITCYETPSGEFAPAPLLRPHEAVAVAAAGRLEVRDTGWLTREARKAVSLAMAGVGPRTIGKIRGR